MATSALFVTGTDTGIGKTTVSAALLHALRANGGSAVGMKPVASGCERMDGPWRNEDALALQAASQPTPDYALINPFALPQPLAPELAAAEAGIELSLPPLQQAFQQLQQQASTVVVEGVGGWAAPLNAQLDQLDLLRALGGMPVLLVVGLRLGCISHARLTVAALAAAGVDCVGWVCNGVDPAMARQDENFQMLTQRLPMPCWGRLPYAPELSAAELAAYLQLPNDWK